jgi:hypothetical protein
MTLRRFSSLRERLDHAFLRDRLKSAKSYKRIAGYFRSSIFELVGEDVAAIPKVQIVCNSELDAADVAVSRQVRETALKERWNQAAPEVEALLHADRYRRLHALLTSGRVEIRVVPKDRVFVHGKAEGIEAVDGSKTCFLGSINEPKSAFANNYEILWEDPSAEGVAWVEEEFDALWADAFPLSEAIVEEVRRVAERVEVSASRTPRRRTYRPPHWPRAPSIAEVSSSSLGNAPSLPSSSSTGRPTTRSGCCWPTRWGWARPCRSRRAPWSPPCWTTARY